MRAFIKEQMKGINAPNAEEIKLGAALAAEEIFFAITGDPAGGVGGKVEICMEVDRLSRRLMITLAKSGLPFNPLRCRQPDYGLEAGPGESGNPGCKILRYMDRLRYEYRAGKNVIIITKSW